MSDGRQKDKTLRSLDVMTETDAKRALRGKDDHDNVHIELTDRLPNTTILMSTLYGGKAHRNHFLPALAEEIRKADGKRTVYDMFVSASHSMMSHPEFGRQNPEHRSTNRHNLIIPERTN